MIFASVEHLTQRKSKNIAFRERKIKEDEHTNYHPTTTTTTTELIRKTLVCKVTRHTVALNA
jgi:hypothetical protein